MPTDTIVNFLFGHCYGPAAVPSLNLFVDNSFELRITLVTGGGKDMEIAVFEAYNQNQKVATLYLKMPSIAVADEDRARAFAKNLAQRIALGEDENGMQKLLII